MEQVVAVVTDVIQNLLQQVAAVREFFFDSLIVLSLSRL